MEGYSTTTTPHGRYLIVNTTTRDEWLDARRQAVTASKIAQLARLRATDWERIRREDATGHTEFHGNEYTEWGLEREPFIIDFIRAEVDPTITHNTQLLLSSDNPCYAATPDGISLDGQYTCQIKTTSKPLDPENPPRDYMDQMQWEMLVTGASSCIFAVEEHDNFEVIGTRYAIVDADRERQSELAEIADRFLAGGDPVELDDDARIAAAVDAWAAAEEQLADAKQRATAAKNLLRDLVDPLDGEKFTSRRFTVTRIPAGERTSLDQTALRKNYPEAWEACQVTKPTKPVLRAPRRVEPVA